MVELTTRNAQQQDVSGSFSCDTAAIHISYQRINDIVNGRRGITPSATLRSAKFFNMLADFWMNVQLRWDMYFAWQDEITVLETIQPLPVDAGQ